MKYKIIRILYILPSVIYAYIIFYISSIDKPVVVEPPFPHSDKIFHLIEYAGFTMTLFYSSTKVLPELRFVKKIIWCIMIAVFYAVTDEYHQSFTIYRKSDFFDWIADTAGSLTAGIIICTSKLFWKNH
ncbi:VanZ family protein [Candidatus Dependentiae bacterium]|nr:VanZ family protein [Candidatus Dependentiae bacterium]